jgi:hypothetical protein
MITTNIPALRVDFIDKRTGLMSREWYLFFLNLFNLLGGGSNSLTLTDLQQSAPSVTIDELNPNSIINQFQSDPLALVDTEALNDIRQWLDALPAQSFEQAAQDVAPPLYPPQINNSALILPSSITVGASPFTYTNNEVYDIDVIVQSGTVSLIEFSRDGTTWYTTGLIVGMFNLSKSDRLRVTYTVLPTMTMIPR